jgi:hypothetical protein
MSAFFNNLVNKLPRTEISLSRRRLSAFQLCGCTGLLLGFVQSMLLTRHLGLSQLTLLGMTGVVILTFYALMMATKILTGEESIIYYHHEIAVIAAIALFLRLTHQPVLRYLDVAILGIGLFLACGRVGCLMVGCCHGCPVRWGVRYGDEHAKAGFPECYVGVRLFPVQALESLFVFATMISGSVLLFGGARPGEAMAWYTVVYGWGRFSFEFLRGDSDRPYYWGFSQPQWISSILMTGLVWAELRGAIPFHRWHLGASAALILTMLVITITRRLRSVPQHLLLHPRHVRELAELLRRVYDPRRRFLQPACVGHTSLGVLISADLVRKPGCRIFHYAISARNTPLTDASARLLAGLILRLKHPSCTSNELTRGDHGVFHLLVPIARRTITARAA